MGFKGNIEQVSLWNYAFNELDVQESVLELVPEITEFELVEIEDEVVFELSIRIWVVLCLSKPSPFSIFFLFFQLQS